MFFKYEIELEGVMPSMVAFVDFYGINDYDIKEDDLGEDRLWILRL